VNPNPIGALDHASDRLLDNRIPITRAAANKRDSHCTPQISDNNTEAVEGEMNVPFSLEVIREAQHKDDSISTVIQYLKAGAPPNNLDLRSMPEECKVLLAQWDSLLVRDYVLCRRYYHRDGTTKFLHLVLPGSLRLQYVSRLHVDLGHFERTKTCLAVSQRVCFPG